jgi:hypothetical protein
MTRQEVAVARSHIEIWKAIASGEHKNVLVLEDDVWFKWDAAAKISSGWQTALKRCSANGGPRLLYLSYEDAGGTAERLDQCSSLFRPQRGLWFLSGYVLSREGAAALLRAMPVIGPVDMWMNYRFKDLGALALSSPAILQRQDGGSDNSYSVLPYLARAGVVDTSASRMAPSHIGARLLLAWTAGDAQEGLAMALSMLGLRVRVFDGNENALQPFELWTSLEEFDVLVDAPLKQETLRAAINRTEIKFIFETSADIRFGIKAIDLPSARTTFLSPNKANSDSWQPLCTFLNLAEPVQDFPTGAPRDYRIFRDDRLRSANGSTKHHAQRFKLDDSPWILPPLCNWRPTHLDKKSTRPAGDVVVFSDTNAPWSEFQILVETFPGNLATFSQDGIIHDDDGTHLILRKIGAESRPYLSGAFVSRRSFAHGRFEAEIKAASGPGLVTGFFLHRASPRQEIDVELIGADPCHMLVNVYFNPGDDGAEFGFGYRGTPCRIDLGFDATLDFHLYAIEWRPDRIAWLVDGRVLHERPSWDPTPIPHLPMRLHANLWAPRSEELAGRIDHDALPSKATFKKVVVRALASSATTKGNSLD